MGCHTRCIIVSCSSAYLMNWLRLQSPTPNMGLLVHEAKYRNICESLNAINNLHEYILYPRWGSSCTKPYKCFGWAGSMNFLLSLLTWFGFHILLCLTLSLLTTSLHSKKHSQKSSESQRLLTILHLKKKNGHPQRKDGLLNNRVRRSRFMLQRAQRRVVPRFNVLRMFKNLLPVSCVQNRSRDNTDSQLWRQAPILISLQHRSFVTSRKGLIGAGFALGIFGLHNRTPHFHFKC